MNSFEVVKTVFDSVKIIKTDTRTDNRGPMTVYYNDDKLAELGIEFRVRESRTYEMVREGTFFGIHYQTDDNPGAKLVSLIKGRGMDYAIDLRPDSPTFLNWEATDLSAENGLAAYVPTGFGHAFIALSDDVIMLYQTDFHGRKGVTGRLNYRNESIGLEFPVKITEIADYDDNAPMEFK